MKIKELYKLTDYYLSTHFTDMEEMFECSDKIRELEKQIDPEHSDSLGHMVSLACLKKCPVEKLILAMRLLGYEIDDDSVLYYVYMPKLKRLPSPRVQVMKEEE